MRTRHRCPKCDHGEVLHIPEPQDSDSDRMALGGGTVGWTTVTAHAPLEAYVCIGCGYVELYAKGVVDLKKIKNAHVLKAEAGTDPYRT